MHWITNQNKQAYRIYFLQSHHVFNRSHHGDPLFYPHLSVSPQEEFAAKFEKDSPLRFLRPNPDSWANALTQPLRMPAQAALGSLQLSFAWESGDRTGISVVKNIVGYKCQVIVNRCSFESKKSRESPGLVYLTACVRGLGPRGRSSRRRFIL